jgi:hypothetical protein
MMKSKSAQILFHVIGCTIFLSLPIIFWPGQGGIAEFFSDIRAMRGYVNDILILLFFYLNFYYLIPKLYFQKRYAFFILALTICFFIIAFLPEIILPFQEHGHIQPEPGMGPGPHQEHDGNRFMFSIGHHIIFFLAVVFLSLMLKINNRWRQAEKEKLKAELSYFKAQINPHFLFNTLNTIYSLAIQKAGNTAEAVVKLSGMMRYVISDASQDFVPLEKEISYIGDYIDLQKIRFGETVKIDYNPCDSPADKYIAPLILIPFIENAFKFGINSKADSYIGIDINLSGAELHMKVFNNKVISRQETEPSGGLGISNASQRLALLYPEKHRLLIDETGSEFTVDLYINLS